MKNEKELDSFVSREVVYCQSSLVDHCLSKEIFSYDDITNAYSRNEDCACDRSEDIECDCEDQPQEIFEWWIVTGWLLEKLEAQGEPILHTDFGSWWGRTCTGQAISMDHVIGAIYDEMMAYKA
jgi:hypothetical protein